MRKRYVKFEREHDVVLDQSAKIKFTSFYVRCAPFIGKRVHEFVVEGEGRWIGRHMVDYVEHLIAVRHGELVHLCTTFKIPN